MTDLGLPQTSTNVRRSQRIRSHQAQQAIPLPSVQRIRPKFKQQRIGEGSQSEPQESEPNDDEIIDADDTCMICQQLLYKPVRTQCNHTLCESCMRQWAEISIDITEQLTILPVNTPSVASDHNNIATSTNPSSNTVSLAARCPMCRTHTFATLDTTRCEILASKYPRTWASIREAHRDSEFSSRNGVTNHTLTLDIGNHHRILEQSNEIDGDEDGDVHEWTFFLRPSRDALIEEVQILLVHCQNCLCNHPVTTNPPNKHPTFQPHRIIRTRPPFSIPRQGWGTFTITAYVILRPGYRFIASDAEDSPDGCVNGMIGLEWTLSFEGEGCLGRRNVKVRSDRERADADNDEAPEDVFDEEERRDEREWRRVVREYQRDGVYVPPPLGE